MLQYDWGQWGQICPGKSKGVRSSFALATGARNFEVLQRGKYSARHRPPAARQRLTLGMSYAIR